MAIVDKMDSEMLKKWDALLEDLQKYIPTHSYTSWFLPLQPVSSNEQALRISAPNRFHSEYVEMHYRDVLRKCIKSVFGKDLIVQFTIAESLKKDISSGNSTPESPLPPPVTERGDRENLPPQEYYVEDRYSQLNGRYTFETFVEGPHNQFAKVASRAVAEAPGNTAFNPLLIYGGTGLGKTHLLQAIGHYARTRNPNRRVIYVSSEKFMVDFITAIRNNRLNEFGNIYRKADLLLVDDIQFLESREGTQEQFFHTFNDLYQHGKQIVITSDRTPKELKGVEERLISRFLSGLTVDIQPPDFESRIAILQKKADMDQVIIPPEVIEFVAQNITTNVRELEGAMTRIFAYSSLAHTDVTINLAKKVIKDILGVRKARHISIDIIQSAVSDYYKVTENELMGKGRKREVALARQVIMFLSREISGMSLKTIGLRLGRRDHTTVMHACNVIGKKIRENKEFAREIDTIRHQIDLTAG
ncbi:TPA: chromosomal replication initiator protein DnaA [Candidatus Marinimicrobia bacterium]|nr:MAG: Chromosomal replication initiator protein DnaA [Marinimicrobia bacterium 46_47]KUK91691.1 MAG: chromosomal replication initiation protein [Marinimicrobia bacterium 46_43]HAE87189.1 chromosomal replication initiator protein DnaA [Candidatus Neomarinimicrobiota bacterium]HBY17780.1 chromosomal replication initiator protein DnaA [Candidatus Neomarinimicrobiota bacterium]